MVKFRFKKGVEAFNGVGAMKGGKIDEARVACFRANRAHLMPLFETFIC